MTPEKETLTRKVVEDFKEKLTTITGYYEKNTGIRVEEEMLKSFELTILAQNQAADERLREVFKELLQTDRTIYVYKSNIEEIAAKHGITNLYRYDNIKDTRGSNRNNTQSTKPKRRTY